MQKALMQKRNIRIGYWERTKDHWCQLNVSLAVVDAIAASRRVTAAIQTKPACAGYKNLDQSVSQGMRTSFDKSSRNFCPPSSEGG